jgi:hypothetical protein
MILKHIIFLGLQKKKKKKKKEITHDILTFNCLTKTIPIGKIVELLIKTLYN